MTNVVFCSPDLLSDTADPECSVRYTNVNIIHERIQSDYDDVTFYNDIAKTNQFIVEDRSTNYVGYECGMFIGTVIQEKNGDYGWWKNLKQL